MFHVVDYIDSAQTGTFFPFILKHRMETKKKSKNGMKLCNMRSSIFDDTFFHYIFFLSIFCSYFLTMLQSGPDWDARKEKNISQKFRDIFRLRAAQK